MSAILIKSATIVSPGDKLNGKKRDILVDKGKILEIGIKIALPKGAKEIKCTDLHVSCGWIDLAARMCDPGLEHKEDLQSGLKAAAAGGFTGVVVKPMTSPVADNKSAIEYVINQSRNCVTKALPTGTISQGGKGQQLAEMYDMASSGAVAFSDDKNGIERTELMHRALEYSVNLDALIYSFPHDPNVIVDGLMHEGYESTLMGTRGIPVVAETIRLQRDLQLQSHAGGRMHVMGISAASSVDALKKGKKDKLAVTSSVAAHHLLFNDSNLAQFDSNYKVLPPFRHETDRKALIKGLKNGTIDTIMSDHTPEDIERKKVEFAHAAFGISSLETTFAMARTATVKDLPLDDLIEAMSSRPRAVLGMPEMKIEEGGIAELTLFCPNEKWTVDTKKFFSKSKNNPLDGRELVGKVVGVMRESKSSFQL